MPTWKRNGYIFRMYENDHAPLHVHVFKEGRQLDRFDLESGTFMDGTIGKHRGRVLHAMKAAGII